MSAKSKAVVDTSVIVSAILGDPEKAPAKALRAMLEGKFEAYSSREAMEELYDVFFSEKIIGLLKGKGEVATLTYVLVNSVVKIVNPKRKIELCRDSEDNKFLEIAYEAKAEYIVTLDRDLLELRDEKKEVELFEHQVKVLRPEEFLEIVG